MTELLEMAKTHPMTALQTAYGEGKLSMQTKSAIENAIAIERERCAMICEKQGSELNKTGSHNHGQSRTRHPNSNNEHAVNTS